MPRTTINMNDPVQGDMFQRMRDMLDVTSVEMANFVYRMNHFPGGESKMDFTAVEVALVLFNSPDTKRVYALYDSAAIGGSDFGTGPIKRDLHVSRASLYKFLQQRCSDQASAFNRR